MQILPLIVVRYVTVLIITPVSLLCFLGSLVLVGGDPGVGKSTLLLQVCVCLMISYSSVGKCTDYML